MKKTVILILTILAILAIPVASLAASEPMPEVYVTISDGKGEIVVAKEAVELRDFDGDGELTVADALYAAHEKCYDGGAEAGFGTAKTEYGTSLTKLFGDESGAFGYYVNHKSAMSLSDKVKSGDHVKAYVYTDQATWSDAYSWFDPEDSEIMTDDEITLTLYKASFAADWSVVTSPLAGAKIVIDGEVTDIVTDKDGKFTYSTLESGEHIISAVSSDGSALVPPIAIINVEQDFTVLYISLAVVIVSALGVGAFVIIKKRRNNA